MSSKRSISTTALLNFYSSIAAVACLLAAVGAVHSRIYETCTAFSSSSAFKRVHCKLLGSAAGRPGLGSTFFSERAYAMNLVAALAILFMGALTTGVTQYLTGASDRRPVFRRILQLNCTSFALFCLQACMTPAVVWHDWRTFRMVTLGQFVRWCLQLKCLNATVWSAINAHNARLARQEDGFCPTTGSDPEPGEYYTPVSEFATQILVVGTFMLGRFVPEIGVVLGTVWACVLLLPLIRSRVVSGTEQPAVNHQRTPSGSDALPLVDGRCVFDAQDAGEAGTAQTGGRAASTASTGPVPSGSPRVSPRQVLQCREAQGTASFDRAAWLTARIHDTMVVCELCIMALPWPSARALLTSAMHLLEVSFVFIQSQVYLQQRELTATETAAARAQARAAVAMAQTEERANEARRRYLRYLFHEARQPMHAIRLGIDTLEQLLADQHQQQQMTDQQAEVVQNGRYKVGPTSGAGAGLPSSEGASLTNAVPDTAPTPAGTAVPMDGYGLGSPTAEITETLASMKQAAMTQANIFNSVLSLSQMESASFKLALGPTDIRDLLHGVVQQLTPWARSRSIALTEDLDPAVCGQMVIDRVRLAQACMNFVSNALKVVDTAGAGRVVLRARMMDQPPEGSAGAGRAGGRQWLHVEVQDNGVGIPVDQQPYIFQAYHQIATADKSVQGTGLGLPIAKHIVEAHGGSVGFTSTEGHGSTFHMTVPVQRPGSSSDAGSEKDERQNRTVDLGLNEHQGSRVLTSAHPTSDGVTRQKGDADPASNAASTGGNGVAVPARPTLGMAIGTPEQRAGTAIPSTSTSTAEASTEAQTDAQHTTAASTGLDTSQAAGSASAEAADQQESDGAHPGHIAAANQMAAFPTQPACIPPCLYMLVVDDVESNRRMLSRLLKLRLTKLLSSDGVAPAVRLHIHEAGDGQAALDAVRAARPCSCPYAAIFMDAGMPVMDGYEATRQLRSVVGYNGLLLGITGNAMVEDQKHFMACGADAVLAKPVDMQQLQGWLHARVLPSVRSGAAAGVPGQAAEPVKDGMPSGQPQADCDLLL